MDGDRDRALHFGQKDHVRYCGRDLTTRMAAAGFRVEALMPTPVECIEFGLIRGEKVFVGWRGDPGA